MEKIQPEQVSFRRLIKTISHTKRVWFWRSGLGCALNVLPHYLGRQICFVSIDHALFAPLFYCETDGSLIAVVSAQNASACRLALIQNSLCEVWMKSGWFSTEAHFLPETEAQEMIQHLGKPHFFGLYGNKLWQEDTQDLQVIQLRRIAPRTGERGPGQFTWIWAVAAFFFFFAWLFKKK